MSSIPTQVARKLKGQVIYCSTCIHCGNYSSNAYAPVFSGTDTDYFCQKELVSTPHFFEEQLDYARCMDKNKDNDCPDWEHKP